MGPFEFIVYMSKKYILMNVSTDDIWLAKPNLGNKVAISLNPHLQNIIIM